jgi:hypothetical protein
MAAKAGGRPITHGRSDLRRRATLDPYAVSYVSSVRAMPNSSIHQHRSREHRWLARIGFAISRVEPSGTGSGVESVPQPGAAPSPVSGICAVGKVFVTALADRITAASQKVGKARRGGVAVSSGDSALRVEGTAASISEMRALVPISVGIRSDRKPTRREALGGGLPLHSLRGPRRSRHNLARDCGPRLLNHAAMSSRPIAEMVRALAVIRCTVHTFKTARSVNHSSAQPRGHLDRVVRLSDGMRSASTRFGSVAR